MLNTKTFEMETCCFDIPEEYFEDELFPEYPVRGSKRGKRQKVKAARKNKFPVGLRKQLSTCKKVDKQYEKEGRSKEREKFYKKDVETTLQDIEDERCEAVYEAYYERPFYTYQEDDEYYPGDYPDQEEKRKEEEKYLVDTYGDYDFCYPETEAMYDDIF